MENGVCTNVGACVQAVAEVPIATGALLERNRCDLPKLQCNALSSRRSCCSSSPWLHTHGLSHLSNHMGFDMHHRYVCFSSVLHTHPVGCMDVTAVPPGRKSGALSSCSSFATSMSTTRLDLKCCMFRRSWTSVRAATSEDSSAAWRVSNACEAESSSSSFRMRSRFARPFERLGRPTRWVLDADADIKIGSPPPAVDKNPGDSGRGQRRESKNPDSLLGVPEPLRRGLEAGDAAVVTCIITKQAVVYQSTGSQIPST